MLLFGCFAGKMSRSVSELTNNDAIIQIIFHTCLIFIKKWQYHRLPVNPSYRLGRGDILAKIIELSILLLFLAN